MQVETEDEVEEGRHALSHVHIEEDALLFHPQLEHIATRKY
jgi:hypothetical protein